MKRSGDQNASPNAAVELPEAVRAKATLLGGEGERWVRDLPAVVASLVDEWGLAEVGPPMPGGSAAFLAEVVSAQHGPAVLKLAMPDGLVGNSTFAQELLALDTGGYLVIHERDVERRALLLERLGRPLSALGFSTEQQLDVLARTVAATWRPLDAGSGFPTGAEKAVFLIGFIEDRWEETGRPCGERAVTEALRFAERRRAAFDPERAVLAHGDVHAGNVLEAASGFKLIDPEGVMSEPAHDLGLALRGYDPGPGGGAQLRTWCERIAAIGGTDPEPVWEWAFIEKVSTGLYLTELGIEDEARVYLRVADLLASER